MAKTNKMNLALHIGMEKTGTSLLQTWLYENKKQLGHQGYFLSDRIGKPVNRLLVAYFRSEKDDFWQNNDIQSEKEKKSFFLNFLQAFESELRAAEKTHHTMVISAEHFHSRLYNPNDLVKFSDFCRKNFKKIKVICYLRPQWSVRLSRYSTAVKIHQSLPLEEFQVNLTPDNEYYNYYNLYHRWGKAFGIENLDFRIYDKTTFYMGDLRYDLCNAIGGYFDFDSLDLSISSRNKSIGSIMANALIGVNKAAPRFLDKSIDARNHFYKSIITDLDILNRGYISDKLAPNIEKIFHDSNSRLAHELFGRDILFNEPTEKDMPEVNFSADEVGQIIENLVFSLIKQTSSRILLNSDAEFLRTVALTYFTDQKITREQALNILKLAERAHPSGDLELNSLNNHIKENQNFIVGALRWIKKRFQH